MTSSYQNLAQAGVALWLDDLSRPRIISGGLTRLVSRGDIVGITTNPAIFSKSISAGSGYEKQVRELSLRGTAIGETLRLLTAWDVRAACDILKPVFDATNGRDGRVSIEVDPRISADAERTTAEASGLWWLVDRPNLYIKIPATEAALPAITAAIAEGISVNVTLIFSISRYKAVLNAFMTGLEQRTDRGEDLAGIESVASFFISRVDTEVDKRLGIIAEAGDEAAKAKAADLHGQAAIANAKLAYEAYEAAKASNRWRTLAAKGAALQRLLWASTGVKDKASATTRYVTELVAPDTVNTMPEATLTATGDFDEPIADRVSGSFDEARTVAADLAAIGVDLEDVAKTLEREGVAAFVQSWNDLIASVEKQIESAGAKVMPAGSVKPAEGSGAKSPGPAAAAPARTATGGRK